MALMDLGRKAPVTNEEARKRINAGKAIQLQQAAKAGAINKASDAQQLATQAEQATGQALLNQQAQENQQQVGFGSAEMQRQNTEAGLDLQQAGMNQQQALADQQRAQGIALSREDMAQKKRLTEEELQSAERLSGMGIQMDESLSYMSRRNREDLARLGQDIKHELFDSRLQFERDEMGRKFTNERQMADAAIATAKTRQELKERLDEMQHVANNEIIMLENVHSQLVRAYERGYLDEQQKLNQEHKRVLATVIQNMEDKIRKRKNRAASTRMIIAGTVGIAATVATGGAAAPAIPGLMAAANQGGGA